MKSSQFALLIGLILGLGQFFLVLVFGALGLAVGLALEGRIEVRGITDRRKD